MAEETLQPNTNDFPYFGVAAATYALLVFSTVGVFFLPHLTGEFVKIFEQMKVSLPQPTILAIKIGLHPWLLCPLFLIVAYVNHQCYKRRSQTGLKLLQYGWLVLAATCLLGYLMSLFLPMGGGLVSLSGSR